MAPDGGALNFSGAALAALVNEAAIGAVRRAGRGADVGGGGGGCGIYLTQGVISADEKNTWRKLRIGNLQNYFRVFLDPELFDTSRQYYRLR